MRCPVLPVRYVYKCVARRRAFLRQCTGREILFVQRHAREGHVSVVFFSAVAPRPSFALRHQFGFGR
eukprot:241323-Lingulodinium_polyedra.AAC.1